VSKIPIACTLSADDRESRRGEWVAMIGRATSRHEHQLTFPRAVAVELADLIAREVDCCAFFTFTMTVNHNDVVLDVTAPPEAEELVTALVQLTADPDAVKR
jgi:hypothetical protein